MFASAFEFGAALLPIAISSNVDSRVAVPVVLPFCASAFVELPFPRFCVGPACVREQFSRRVSDLSTS